VKDVRKFIESELLARLPAVPEKGQPDPRMRCFSGLLANDEIWQDL